MSDNEKLEKGESFVVPQAVRNNAKRGLELRRKHGRGGITNQQASKQGIGSGVQRASDLMSGSVSEKTVRRMHAFFARHSAFKKFHKDKTSAAFISWLIWGGDAGKRWADSVVNRLNREDQKGKVKKSGFAWIGLQLDALAEFIGKGSADEEMVGSNAVCDCAECMAQMDQDRFGDWEDEAGGEDEGDEAGGGEDSEDGEETLDPIEKARSVPEKYLEGLTGEERAKRKKEIQERMESGKTGGYKELTGDDKDTKPSKHTQSNVAARIRAELKGKTSKGEFLTVAARVSGVARSILERCYDRGMAAWATGGHRPGASQTAWAVARVYSLLSGGRTRSTADKDLWAEHLKNKRED